jgi:acyl CoA:acetate/3-ketoacid CoA transferase alpha subunit
MDKTYESAAAAVADIGDGASMAVGGFGLVGVPIVLIRAILAQGTANLEMVSNNCGVDGWYTNFTEHLPEVSAGAASRGLNPGRSFMFTSFI